MAIKNLIKVNEMFKSIQGESTFAGRVCFFIRLAGCNLNCSYCDTTYAQSPDAGKDFTIEQIVQSANDSGVKLAEITGGEPLLQKSINDLCQALLDENFEVMMETNGSQNISKLPPGVKRILDCKLPSSNMSRKNLYSNYRCITPYDEIKFVIADRNDYDFACDIIKRYKLDRRTSNLLASPVWGKISPETLAQYLIDDNSPMRMQLQMHKIIWGAEKTGV